MGSWFKKYAEVKVSGLVQSVRESLVAADLNGASEADLLVYESNLDKLVQETAVQRAEAERERKEANEIVALYNQKLAAIGILQEQVAAETDQSMIDQINAVIEEEVSALEAMQADVEREEQEAVEAEAALAEMQEFSSEAAKALKNARAELKAVKAGLEKANRAVERDEARLKRQQELKGLAANTGKLTTALEIMKKQTADAKVKADAIKMKSDLLGVGDDKKSDIMQKAMAAASGKAPAPAASIADRLAALKKK